MLLGIDTSTQSVGIAIYDGHQILCEESWLSRRYHTVELAGAVDANLKRAGLNPKDLDVLAVATGPGSFTGLRIGMALVKGLAYTHQLPVIGTGGALAFVGRAVQHVDRYIATRPSWATLALGAWVTLVLMMLRQQWLARRKAAGATKVPTDDLISKVLASSAKRRKSTARGAVQAEPKSASEARQESADRTLSESVPQD